VTAAVTGFLLPYVLKRIDARKAREQKEHEAHLARQARVIEAQSKFLDDLSQGLWNWRYLAIKVTYYGGHAADDKYAAARKDYDDRVWDTLNRVRNEISRSRRLVSETSYTGLLELYKEMVELDMELSSCSEKPNVDRGWALAKMNHHIYSHFTKKIDDTLDALASEMSLKATGQVRMLAQGGKLVK
jgi:hypothetical protein